MELNNLYLISVSVFSILASVFMLLMGFFAVVLIVKLIRLARKAEELADFARETVGEVGQSLKDTSSSIETFVKGLFTVDAIKKTIVEVIELIKKRKGADSEKRD